MAVDKSHTNYSDELYQYLSSINQLTDQIELMYADEKRKLIKNRKPFNPKKHYELLKLLSQGALSLRKVNDFEASKVALYKIIPLFQKYISRLSELQEKSEDNRYAKYFDIVNYYWDVVGVGARYSLNSFIEYMFHDKNKDPYTIRKEILAPAVFYVGRGFLERLHLGIDFNDGIKAPKTVLFSTFPSSGKTLVANYAMTWIKCLSMIKTRGGGMLRIGNEDGNVNQNSSNIKDIINDPTIFGVFPELAEYKDDKGKYKPFEKDSIDEWNLRGDKEAPKSAVFKTSGSATNGVRINLGLIIDDPSRGMVDRKNVEIHKKIISSYNGDWKSRFDNEEDSFTFALGTRFNNFDLFSFIQEEAEQDNLMPSKMFDNTMITEDGETVVINIDCEMADGSGRSRYPDLISDKTLEKKRRSMSKQEYYCVYRQKPIPEEGLDFDYALLRTYDTKYEDSQLDMLTSYAACDPSRKSGADYLSMPIFKRIIDTQDPNFGKYALVDVIFRQKSVKDPKAFEDIINKTMDFSIKKLYLEINTDTSLGSRITDHLKKLDYNSLRIKEIFNYLKKSERIADQTSSIINNIVFPSEGLFPKYTEIGQFMEQVTMYSSTAPNKHEDAVDSLAIFSREHIDSTRQRNRISCSTKSLR